MNVPKQISVSHWIDRAELRGIGLNYLHVAVAGLAFVVVVPTAIGSIGAAGYGVWVVCNSIAGYLLLADLGAAVVVARYTAVHRASGSTESLQSMLSTLAVPFLLLAAGVVLATALAAPWLPFVLEVPTGMASEASRAFAIVGVNIGITFLSLFAGNVVYGMGRIDLSKAATTAGQASGTVTTVGLLLIGQGLVGLAVGALVGTLTTLAINAWNVRRMAPDLRLDLTQFDWKTLKEVAPYGLRTFTLGLTSRVLYHTDSLVIAFVVGTSAVTAYDLVYRVCFFASYLFSSVSTVLFPRFASLFATGNLERARATYVETVRWSMNIAVPVGLCLLAFTPSLLELWVGPGLFVGEVVLVILVAMNVAHAIGTPAAMLLQSSGRNQEMTRAEVVNAALNAGLSVVLAVTWGVPGVAAATLIAHMFTSFWVLQLVPARLLDLSVRQLWADSILFPVLCGVPIAITIAMLMGLGEVSSILGIAAGALLVCAGYALTATAATAWLRKSAEPAATPS